MSNRFIHAVANVKISFLFMAKRYSIVCGCACLYVYISHLHSSINGHLCCSHIFAIVKKKKKKTAMNMEGYISVFKLVFLFFSEKYPKVELLDHVIVLCVCMYVCVFKHMFANVYLFFD